MLDVVNTQSLYIVVDQFKDMLICCNWVVAFSIFAVIPTFVVLLIYEEYLVTYDWQKLSESTDEDAGYKRVN